MTQLVDYTIQISTILVLALVTAWVLGRRSAGLRHAIVAVAVVCAMVLLAVTAVIPWEWGLTTAPAAGLPTPEEPRVMLPTQQEPTLNEEAGQLSQSSDQAGLSTDDAGARFGPTSVQHCFSSGFGRQA
jgi:hypothetical protein